RGRRSADRTGHASCTRDRRRSGCCRAQRARRQRSISNIGRGLDRANQQIAALRSAACVVAATPYVTDELKEIAHVLLPMASFAETSGSYVSLEGRSQSQTGVSKPPGEARPGWKVLRVLGNQLELDGFNYQSSEDVRDELQQIVGANAGAAVPTALVTHHVPAIAAVAGAAELDLGALDVPMYAIDAVLRRSPALQQTAIAAATRRLARVG
ncbi:MAG: molybdopterin-dependent oxidoreductase, partial [Gammaproteobacteria bacterium]